MAVAEEPFADVVKNRKPGNHPRRAIVLVALDLVPLADQPVPGRHDPVLGGGPAMPRQAFHGFREELADPLAALDAAPGRVDVDRVFREEIGKLRPGPFPGVDLVAQIVFRCTVYHASINYSSFPLFSFPANVPTASFGAAPTGGASDTEAAWEAMLPPFDLACEALTLFYEITVRINRLGDYPRGHFRDERVAPLLAAHQSALEAAGEIIDKRNSTRLMPYPYMHPAQVSLSIHV